MADKEKLSARVIGQIALMQSVVVMLPDKRSVLQFVSKGIEDVPGVKSVDFILPEDEGLMRASPERNQGDVREVRIEHEGNELAVLRIHLDDTHRFFPYIPYIENLGSVMAITLEEKRQRKENDLLLENLEAMVHERTRELGETNEALSEEIAERKKIAADRARFLRELEIRNADLERFNYTISHELRAPLITISGFASKLNKDVQQNNEDALQKDIGFISDAVMQADSLLDDVLQYSRASHGNTEKAPVSLKEMTDEAIALMRSTYGELCDAIRVPDDLPEVYADRTALLEVMRNLLSNAIKYRDMDRELVVKVCAKPGTPACVVSVEDNGIGIAPDYQERIFRLFERLSPAGSGNGIGLSIVKAIITRHGGEVWVRSKEGGGSTFCFTLPSRDSDEIPS